MFTNFNHLSPTEIIFYTAGLILVVGIAIALVIFAFYWIVTKLSSHVPQKKIS